MTFSMVPRTPFPRLDSDGFPQGIQWQADGTDLGDRHVQTVHLDNFGTGGATRDEDTLTITAPAAGGGSGGGDTTAPVGARVSRSTPQTSGQTVLFDDDSTNGNWNSGNYNPATGIYTVPAEDDGFIHQIDAGL